MNRELVLTFGVLLFKQVEKRPLREKPLSFSIINVVPIRLASLTSDMLDNALIVRKQPLGNRHIPVLLDIAIDPERHAHLDNRGRRRGGP